MSALRGRREQMQETVYPSDPYTFVKHRSYAHYLNCWLPRILRTHPRATVVDAFSGAGVYADGEPGSSVVVAQTVLDHAQLDSWKGSLGLISLEKRADRTARLRSELAAMPSHTKFSYEVQPPGSLAERSTAIQAQAHGGSRRTPVLWLLDPYGPADLPYDAVRSLLCSGNSDEVVVSFFAKEMHQRREVKEWQTSMTTHFGGDEWTPVLDYADQRRGMEVLVESYCAKWKADGIHANRFAIRVSNDLARYYLVLLTRHPAGLECWTKMARRMDSYTGTGASPMSLDQDTLFAGNPSTYRMRALLAPLAGREVTWHELTLLAFGENQSPKVLRLTLTELNEEGLAFRQSPLNSRTPWPEDCRVRFYSPQDLRSATDLTPPEGLPLQPPLKGRT